MMNSSSLFLFGLLLWWTPFAAQDPAAFMLPQQVQENQELFFTENKGQVVDQFNLPRPDVLFSGRTEQLTYYLQDNGISYQGYRMDATSEEEPLLTIQRTDIRWIGHNADFAIEKGQALPERRNYYTAQCGTGITDVGSYASITYRNLFNGIDLKWYARNGEAEYDFHVSPGADYKQIQWIIEGAEKLSISPSGELLITTALGTIAEQAPVAFQQGVELRASWMLDGNRVSFVLLDPYNEREVLVIDPIVRTWGSYFGGTSLDRATDCGVDASGNLYITGITTSTSMIATSGSYQTTLAMAGFRDAFLSKFTPGGQLIWSTYYGGTGSESTEGLCVDANSCIYVAGSTKSPSGMGTAGGFQPTYGGGLNDGFLARFDSTGALLWATYYGGNLSDFMTACVADDSLNVYVCGNTSSSSGISTSGSHQASWGGVGSGISGSPSDAFLVKFDSSGSRQWATYYGGDNSDFAAGIALDNQYQVYISGQTSSKGTGTITTIGTHQPAFGLGSNPKAYVAKFQSSGTRIWGTYYGGTGYEWGEDVKTDDSLNVYLLGKTSSSTGISTLGSHQPTLGGGDDVMLVKFNSQGQRLWGTYFGDLYTNDADGLEIDSEANLYIAGNTFSPNPGSAGVFGTYDVHQPTYEGGLADAFLASFDALGGLNFSTYYGGTSEDVGIACALADSTTIYLAGWSSSDTLIASNGAYQTTRSGDLDAFIAQFSLCQPYYDTVSITACDSLLAPSGNMVWLTSGIYTDTLINGNGCDTFVTVNATIYPTLASTAVLEACDSLTWINGITYYSSNNTAVDTLMSTTGCDSIVSLNLTIHTSATSAFAITSCDAYTWPSNGQTYTSSGSYLDTLSTSQGCDSVITLNLTILQSTVGNEVVTTCNSHQWAANGISYTASGAYTDTITNAAGCDSVVTLDLTILDSSSSTLFDTACFEYSSPAGNVYTSSGTYQETIANEAGCDSNITLNLTIVEVEANVQLVFDQGVHSLKAEPTTGSFQWIDCAANGEIPGAESDTFVPHTAGSYAVIRSIQNCWDTSECVSTPVGISMSTNNAGMRVYPNPAKGFLTLQSDQLFGRNSRCEVHTMQGSLVRSFDLPGNSKETSLRLDDLPKGSYLLKVEGDHAVQTFRFVLI